MLLPSPTAASASSRSGKVQLFSSMMVIPLLCFPLTSSSESARSYTVTPFGQILEDGNPMVFTGVNAMHVFGGNTDDFKQ